MYRYFQNFTLALTHLQSDSESLPIQKHFCVLTFIYFLTYTLPIGIARAASFLLLNLNAASTSPTPGTLTVIHVDGPGG